MFERLLLKSGGMINVKFIIPDSVLENHIHCCPFFVVTVQRLHLLTLGVQPRAGSLVACAGHVCPKVGCGSGGPQRTALQVYSQCTVW